MRRTTIPTPEQNASKKDDAKLAIASSWGAGVLTRTHHTTERKPLWLRTQLEQETVADKELERAADRARMPRKKPVRDERKQSAFSLTSPKASNSPMVSAVEKLSMIHTTLSSFAACATLRKRGSSLKKDKKKKTDDDDVLLEDGDEGMRDDDNNEDEEEEEGDDDDDDVAEEAGEKHQQAVKDNKAVKNAADAFGSFFGARHMSMSVIPGKALQQRKASPLSSTAPVPEASSAAAPPITTAKTCFSSSSSPSLSFKDDTTAAADSSPNPQQQTNATTSTKKRRAPLNPEQAARRMSINDVISPMTVHRPHLAEIPFQEHVAERLKLSPSRRYTHRSSSASRSRRRSQSRDAEQGAVTPNKSISSSSAAAAAAVTHLLSTRNTTRGPVTASKEFAMCLNVEDPKRYDESRWNTKEQRIRLMKIRAGIILPGDDGTASSSTDLNGSTDPLLGGSRVLSGSAQFSDFSSGAGGGAGVGGSATAATMSPAMPLLLTPRKKSLALLNMALESQLATPELGFLPRKYIKASKEWLARARERVVDRNSIPILEWYESKCERQQLEQLFNSWRTQVYALRYFRRGRMRQCFWALAENASEQKALFVQQRETTEAAVMRYKVRRILCVWHRMCVLNTCWRNSASELAVKAQVDKMLKFRRNPEFTYRAAELIDVGPSHTALKAAARALPATRQYLIKVMGAWRDVVKQEKKERADLKLLDTWYETSSERGQRAVSGGLVSTREVFHRWQRAWFRCIAGRYSLNRETSFAFSRWRGKFKRIHNDSDATEKVTKICDDRLIARTFYKWQNKFDENKALLLLGFQRLAKNRLFLIPYMLRLLGHDDDRRIHLIDAMSQWRKFILRRRIFYIFVLQQKVEHELALKRRAFAMWKNVKDDMAVNWHTGHSFETADRNPSRVSRSSIMKDDSELAEYSFPKDGDLSMRSHLDKSSRSKHDAGNKSEVGSQFGEEESTMALSKVQLRDLDATSNAGTMRTMGATARSIGPGQSVKSSYLAPRPPGTEGRGALSNIGSSTAQVHVLLPRQMGMATVGSIGPGRHWSLNPPIVMASLRHKAASILKIDQLINIPPNDKLVVVVSTPSDVLPAHCERPTAQALELVHRVAHLPLKTLRSLFEDAVMFDPKKAAEALFSQQDQQQQQGIHSSSSMASSMTHIPHGSAASMRMTMMVSANEK